MINLKYEGVLSKKSQALEWIVGVDMEQLFFDSISQFLRNFSW